MTLKQASFYSFIHSFTDDRDRQWKTVIQVFGSCIFFILEVENIYIIIIWLGVH